MVKLLLMEKAWKSAKRNIFRLEAIPEYGVPEDLALFEKWKQGKLELDEASKEYLEKLKKTKGRGVEMQRVRIVPLPISEYIEYEIDFWEHSIQNGEEILFLEENEYQNLIKNLNFEPRDFWMFDDKVLIIFYYDSKGGFLREEAIQTDKTIKQYKDLKKKLLKKSILMKQFLEKYGAIKN